MGYGDRRGSLRLIINGKEYTSSWAIEKFLETTQVPKKLAYHDLVLTKKKKLDDRWETEILPI